MGKVRHHGRWFWERFDPDRDTGAELAELRRGLGRAAGTIPEMWRHYRAFVPDEAALVGRISQELVAEHGALALFGVHQQGQRLHMHSESTSLGAGLRRLHARDGVGGDALDRRVNAAATSGSVTELLGHLRGLITRLRGHQIAIDYNRLVEDLHAWTWPDSRARVRQRWGTQYYIHQARDTADATTTEETR